MSFVPPELALDELAARTPEDTDATVLDGK